MTNVEKLFEQFTKLNELDQLALLEMVNDYQDKWKLNHVNEEAFNFTERIDEVEENEKSLAKEVEICHAENDYLVRENTRLEKIEAKYNTIRDAVQKVIDK